ncbi:voltage-gated potassium channel [Aureococcus anophagefferens]|nr:voltage-gated potassium channel [Aureococcus anophagefferens]
MAAAPPTTSPLPPNPKSPGTPKASARRMDRSESNALLLDTFDSNSEPNEEQLGTFDKKKGKWMRKSRQVSPYAPSSDAMSPSKMSSRAKAGARTHERAARLVRGVEHTALPPMVRRAKQEITFPKHSWMTNPNSFFFNGWSVSMVPFLAYVAVVTPFEIAFVHRGCSLLAPNLIVDLYFWADVLLNFNTAFFDHERAKWIVSYGARALLPLVMTMIKYTLLIVVITHLWACMIRLIGDTPDCVKYYAPSPDIPGADPPDWYNTDSEGDCWLATVRYRKKGLWFEYVAALEWAAKAMGGESESITFGESFLGFLIMLSGMVMTAFLIGEIANVLTNFDPALNDYRTSMDNLNQYMLERNINKGLQKHLREYYINSEGLFRKMYHREMLQSLSPALQRAVAKEELGDWVSKLPFLNTVVRTTSGMAVGTLVVVAPDEVEFSAHGELQARLLSLDKCLKYTVFYGERWDGGPDVEAGVAHDRLRLPLDSPWLRRFEAANRESNVLVTEISLALIPRLFAAKEFIVRGGAMNDSLFLMFEGSAFRMRAKLGFGDEEEVDKVGGETEDGLSEGLSTGEFLSARNHDVIGVEIIHSLVGAQMPSAFDVAAIGHVFVNAISAETLEKIMTPEACPKLLGDAKLASWQLCGIQIFTSTSMLAAFKLGVYRTGAFAVQERKARIRYYNAAYLCQKLALKRHYRAVDAHERRKSVHLDNRIKRASEKERDKNLFNLYKNFKPLRWRADGVRETSIVTPLPPTTDESEWTTGQKVYVDLGGGPRPADIVDVFYTSSMGSDRRLTPSTYERAKRPSKSKVAASGPPTAKGDLVYARFDVGLPPQRARVIDVRDDGFLEVSFQNIDLVVKREQISSRHSPGARVRIKEDGCFLERAEARGDRRNKWSGLELERSVNAITTSWQKMMTIDLIGDQQARQAELDEVSGGTVLQRVARVEHIQRETNAKLDVLLAHLKVPYLAPRTAEPELHPSDPDSPKKLPKAPAPN